MTAFITRCLKSNKKLFLAWVWLVCTAVPGWAEGITVRKAELEFVDGQISVSTRFNIKLTNTLYQAMTQGIPLPFRLEFELARPRIASWYLSLAEWFNPHARLIFKLSFQPLTNRYRVTLGSLSTSYPTLEKALAAVGSIQGWRVLGADELVWFSTTDKIVAHVRLEVDIGELPKPYQLNALGSSDWALTSGWVNVEIKGSE